MGLAVQRVIVSRPRHDSRATARVHSAAKTVGPRGSGDFRRARSPTLYLARRERQHDWRFSALLLGQQVLVLGRDPRLLGFEVLLLGRASLPPGRPLLSPGRASLSLGQPSLPLDRDLLL